MESTDRSFTVIDIRKPAQGGKKTSLPADGGRYISKTPFGAARKGFSLACREKKIKGQCTFIVTVQETTRGEDGKIFSYKLKREKLKEPKEITRGGGMFGGGTPITIEYSISGKAVPVPKGI
mgnify:FL=1|jgi:hypothetical protein